MKSLQMGITEFALPCPRQGSIETYSGYGGLPNTGSLLHGELQSQRRLQYPGYIAEKWISHTVDAGDLRLQLSGRMDGFAPGPPALIEEFKSAYHADELMHVLHERPHHPYRLQLLTYGYLHWLQLGERPDLSLTVVCARTRQIQSLKLDLEISSFEEWMQRRIRELAEEHRKFEALKSKRKKVSANFVFPFAEPRPGQKELMILVEDRARTGHARLMLQAPTGLGKTAGVLFPTLRESLQRGQKTVYVTAKNSQHDVAEDAVRRLQEQGLKIRSVTVHAKSKMCLKDEVFCNPQYCEFARDYYTKLDQHQLVEKLAKRKRLSAHSFTKMAKTYGVCPFELQLEAIPRADVVIADYNYVFSPRHILGRLTHNGFGRNTPPNLVIDEAHNLPMRANDYFSASLSSEDLLRWRERATHLTPALLQKLEALLASVQQRLHLVQAAATSDGGRPGAARRVELRPEDFMTLDLQAQELMAQYLGSDCTLQRQDPVLQICNQISAFVAALANQGEEFFCSFTPGARGGTLKIVCCDAANWLKAGYAQFRNVVAFSATLKPFIYYKCLLGMEEGNTHAEEFPSPFPRRNRKIMVIPQISTRLRDRPANYGKIRATIERVLAVRPGNYFVFFPSFDFLEQVAEQVSLPGFRMLRQGRDMGRKDVQSFLDLLRTADQPTAVFAVQGGVFAEGVDYPGEMLIGALIVGPALPSFDFEREQLREYYDKKHGQGFNYAYTFPAMARVVQSAGRVIRSPKDRGVIILMDRRFLDDTFVRALPSDWVEDHVRSLVSTQILADIQSFWELKEGDPQ
ncbi:MAG: ATP-dependent DNA helicase [Bdellovibrionales bacterium]